VDEASDFDIVTAVFGDVHEAALAEPLDGLHAFGCFFDAQGGASEGVEGEAMVYNFLDVHEHVEGWGLGEVEDGVAVEDFVIEAEIVEADDKVCAHEFTDQIFDLGFAVDFVIAARGAVGDADAHAHVAHAIPTAHFISRFLRFEVEVNDVLHERTRALKGESALGAISIRCALIFFERGLELRPCRLK
jgi:hypothetical protein